MFGGEKTKDSENKKGRVRGITSRWRKVDR